MELHHDDNTPNKVQSTNNKRNTVQEIISNLILGEWLSKNGIIVCKSPLKLSSFILHATLDGNGCNYVYAAQIKMHWLYRYGLPMRGRRVIMPLEMIASIRVEVSFNSIKSQTYIN